MAYNISRSRQSIDFKAVTQKYDDKLTTFNDEWKAKFAESDTGGKWNLTYIIPSSYQTCAEPSYSFRSSLLPLYVYIDQPAPQKSLTRSPHQAS